MVRTSKEHEEVKLMRNLLGTGWFSYIDVYELGLLDYRTTYQKLQKWFDSIEGVNLTEVIEWLQKNEISIYNED